MWKHVTENINFQNKKVLDLGAGYCDLAIFAATEGARVLAIEKDPLVAERAAEHIKDSKLSGGNNARVVISIRDIETYTIKQRAQWDVIFCTSVLPYLTGPDKVLEWMKQHAPTSIIEHQYAGDGPGPNWIQDDDDMETWLKHFWPHVTKIGDTALDIRPSRRSLWMCTS